MAPLSPLAGLARRSRCCRILLRSLSLALITTFVLTLVICKAVYDNDTDAWPDQGLQPISTYLMGQWPGQTANLAISRTGFALVVAQALVLGVFRLALLLQVPHIKSTRIYSMLVLLSALSGAGALGTLLGVAIVTIEDNSSLHDGFACATYVMLPLAQVLELSVFVLCVPVHHEWRRRAVVCAVWAAVAVTATIALMSAYVAEWRAGTLSDDKAALQWSGAILGISYYLIDPLAYVSILVNAADLSERPVRATADREAAPSPDSAAVPLWRLACRHRGR